MTFRISGTLMGHDVVKPTFLLDKERDYVDELVLCAKEERLAKLMDRYEKYYRFNGSVLVSRKGRVICSRTTGYSDFTTKEKLTSQMPFQLASVSKQFTAAAIMLLKQQGKLDFDDEVRKYIHQWPYPGMTIRHLLTHTSGLSNYMWLVENKWSSERAPYNHEVVALLIKHNMPLNFVPGRYYSYSNTGYVVLAYLVERITGKFFADFLHENIFEPLGMKNTFAYSQTINRRNHPKLPGFQTTRRGYRLIDETINDGCIGDKGIYSTAEDLYKWDQALYSGKLVSKEILNEAFTMATLRNKRKVPYGFGFRIAEDEGAKTVYHHGLWNGFRTTIVRYLSDGSCIIVLNNTNSDAKQLLVRDIENILMTQEDIPSDELARASLIGSMEE
ncbi:MAG TPA: serine hydrolase domain-containing protein [Chitinophagales bacterium]|nr:serine hydrolase domain-containing protein [Chitinophagales bacterium]